MLASGYIIIVDGGMCVYGVHQLNRRIASLMEVKDFLSHFQAGNHVKPNVISVLCINSYIILLYYYKTNPISQEEGYF